MAGFTSTPKENKKCSLNTLLVFGLRLMGRGFSAGMKLLCTLNLPYVCKKTFRIHELKLLEAVKYSCEENMKVASKEVQNLKKTTTCGVSVDGTWQRRGHMSLNGCVSVISIDTGKILDLEVMTQYCKMCEMNIKCDHECSNYKGSSGNMESVGAFRIFERSVMKRELQYTEYYGDGDSKAFLKVKDIYGEDTVTKLECIGHVQKGVGSRLRKLKKNQRTRWKSNRNLMHGQCPDGKDSWCRYKRALSDKRQYLEKSPGLPNSAMKVIKATYLELCDKNLLKKCLHGMTQNNNESFNNVLLTILPKETFIQQKTLFLGSYIAVLLFNSGYLGLLPVFNYLKIPIVPLTLKKYMGIDKERVMKSKRQSLPSTKL
ncbi:hypothetical protein AVEN_50766-1 [Araneus ventricosus]|uniref:Mutator-like transposase domain-containing protein n=1 Tax=Araneus ventricosus TaxID=182803 RepID=A0A4Y2N098_ARAVE|nr:hypothetical protein AVEN_50766-1 [Araneus ventricosus]